MADFITSDTHFGHANIIKYSNRPFVSVEDMNESMIYRWNEVVKKGDTVYHLGDFAFGKPDFWHHVLDQLNGNIVLIEGNHDKKALKDPSIRNRFAEVHKYLDTTLEGSRIIMMHFPIAEWDGCQKGYLHFHGHCHSSRDVENLKFKRLDVGVDALGKGHYAPQSIKTAIEAVAWRPILGHHDNDWYGKNSVDTTPKT